MAKKLFAGLVVIACLLVVGYFGVNIYVEQKIKKDFDTAIANMPPVVKMTYKDLDADYFKGTVVIKSVDVSSPLGLGTINIEKIVMQYEPFFKNKFNADFFCQNAHFKNPQLIGAIRQFGYDNFSIEEFSFTSRFDENTRDLEVSDGVLTFKDMGIFRFYYSFGNIFPVKNPEDMMTSYKLAVIKDMWYEYEDTLFFMRAIPVWGGKEEVLKNLDLLPHRSELDKKFVVEAKKFINNPKKMRFTIHPKAPCSIAELSLVSSPEGLAEKLNMDIIANP